MFNQNFDFETVIFDWDREKDETLIKVRNISFENIVMAVKSGHLINIIDSPTHNNQKCFLVNIDDYIHVVPFVFDGDIIFLKTIYPSRKQTKYFLS